MSDFPRIIEPAHTTVFQVPTGRQSKTHSGRYQLRPNMRVGRVWTETWRNLRVPDADVSALLAWIEWAWNRQKIFDIEHLLVPGSGKSPNGTGSAGITVNGGSQTGENLDTTGWPTGTSGVARAGDVIKIGGLNLLYRVVLDADSDGSGDATLRINPNIFDGDSPANGASITTTGCKLRSIILTPPQVPDTRDVDLIGRMSVTFGEIK